MLCVIFQIKKNKKTKKLLEFVPHSESIYFRVWLEFGCTCDSIIVRPRYTWPISHIQPPPILRCILFFLQICQLSWSEHIQSTCKMANHQLGFIHHELGNVSPCVCHAIFRSTTLPHLDYCCCKDIEKLNNTHKFQSLLYSSLA